VELCSSHGEKTNITSLPPTTSAPDVRHNPRAHDPNNEGCRDSSDNRGSREWEEQRRVKKGKGKAPVEQWDDDNNKTGEQAAASRETQAKITEIDEEVVQRLEEWEQLQLGLGPVTAGGQ
jgi:hypothetical protein